MFVVLVGVFCFQAVLWYMTPVCEALLGCGVGKWSVFDVYPSSFGWTVFILCCIVYLAVLAMLWWLCKYLVGVRYRSGKPSDHSSSGGD